MSKWAIGIFAVIGVFSVGFVIYWAPRILGSI
jgi:hypothetical protein